MAAAVAADAAVAESGLVIPDRQLIDFSEFLHPSSPHGRRATADAILHGFQTAGFVYLKNHPIPAATLQTAFARSADFFALPDEAKRALAWDSPVANRGYSSLGREKVTQLADAAAVDALRTAAPDLKESLEIGRDDEAGHPNKWPREQAQDQDQGQDQDQQKQQIRAGFHADMMRFFHLCRRLHLDVMRAVALGMGLDEEFFDPFLHVGDNTLRLLHYPGVKADVFRANPGQVRAGEHSDYGSITLLFQDSRGGLQVRSPTGHFVDATPIPGTIVVNAGDLLARWSNDTIKSTIHRVVEPPRDEEEHPPRYSIAYFCNANFASNVDTLPGTYASESDKKYEQINVGQYLAQRLAATY
ncbi:Oxoglutarate/iron-dependent oxygenase [Moelleriella libera RCEF 2490]|uniref:Oxoglutarate/iron-dependent oxygenase n=1 Tax=Moelleriella libera RCEF 2490 TaxID=1081109 RepID=A0A168DDE7_9HYPO|nr:Oxoglutarate/iron-dependent oxygenase [Moelleriella libera RCEF 2490]